MFLVSLRSKVGGCRTGQHRPESESKESKATKMLHLCHSYDLNIFEFMSFIWIHLPYLAHLCVCFVSCLLGTIEIKAGLSRIHLFLSVTDLDHVASTRSVIVFEILRILRILRWVYLSVPCQVFRSKPQTDPKQSLPMVAGFSEIWKIWLRHFASGTRDWIHGTLCARGNDLKAACAFAAVKNGHGLGRLMLWSCMVLIHFE